MTNERGEPRLTINKEFDSFDQFIQEYVTNISKSGVFIRTKQPLPKGTRVDLRFSIIMSDIHTIQGEGEVVRVQDDPPGMGVLFVKLSDYSKDLLEKLLTGGAE